MFTIPPIIKIDNNPITIDCALSKLIVEGAGAARGGCEIYRSRIRIVIKQFYYLNPESALNFRGVMGGATAWHKD